MKGQLKKIKFIALHAVVHINEKLFSSLNIFKEYIKLVMKKEYVTKASVRNIRNQNYLQTTAKTESKLQYQKILP